jgi:FkbM family methyltransferase
MKLIKQIFKFIKLLRNHTWRKGLLNNIAANIELENLIKDLKFETILDVGSNKGQFILLIEKFFKNKTIYSFEPISEILNKQKQFFQYKKNIFFLNIAIGEKTEKKIFYITNRNDSSSFLKISKNINKNKDYQIKEEREIDIKSLDEIMINKNLIKPIIMKIDTQGYELEVLKGSVNLLKKVKYIIVEISKDEIYSGQAVSNEIIDYLYKLNFIIKKENLPTKINNSNYFQCDILFENKLID